MKTLIYGVVGLLFLSGCNSEQNDPQQMMAPGKYAFAVVYENHAWNQSKIGLVVSGNGDIYRYDISSAQPDSILQQELLTESALTRYFEAADYRFIEQMPASQLQTLWRAATQYGKDSLPAPVSICRDAGIFQYLAFSYDTATQKYRSHLIYQTGDFRIDRNLNELQPVKDYLMNKALALNIAYKLDPDGNNWCSGM